MERRTSLAEIRALAEVRFLIRRYLNNTEKLVHTVGLEPQQYMVMLQVRGLPEGEQPTIRALADRLQLRHNSVVELVNRMERRGLLQRQRAGDDKRCVLVSLTTRGEKLFDKIVRQRLAELRITGRDLVQTLGVVLGPEPRGGARKSASRLSRSRG
jgi:DNA-binding MarR family transcriptional regulator